MTPSVLLLQAAAATFSLLGWLILARDGTYGSGATITLGEGATLLAVALVYGWWLSPVAALTAGVKGAALALVIIDIVWVALLQGVAGFAYCPAPACPSAAPFGDVNRYGSLILGAAAAWTAWRAYRRMPGPTQWAAPATALALIIVAVALQAANAKPPA